MKVKTEKKHYAIWCFLLNLLIALLTFGPFILQSGGLFSLGDDFDAQELAFNIFANREIKELDIFFNWGIDIGSDFISSFSFYNLGSPFFWMTLPFQPETFPWLVGWILILKYAVAGLFSFLWLRRHTSEKAALIASVLYAFSGFQAINMIFYHFHDVVAFFPLLLIGFEKLVDEEKKGIFALSVAINALVNWNFFIGEVIFLIIYYFCYCDVITGLYTKKKTWNAVLKQVFTLMGEGLLGIGMAAVLFIPSVYSMMKQPRIKELMGLSDALTWRSEDLLRNIRALLFPAEAMNNNSVMSQMNWYSAGAYLPFVGIVLCTTWVIRERGKKSALNRLLIICLILSAVPVLNNVFMLFAREPYRRWYYMPILMMALASARALEKLQEGDEETHRIALRVSEILLGFMGLFILVMSLWSWYGYGDSAVRDVMNWTSFSVTGVVGTILTIVIIRCSGKKKVKPMRIFAFGICVFSILSQMLTMLEYRQRAEFTPRQLYNKLVLLSNDLEKEILPYRYAFLETDGYFNFSMTHSLPSIDSFISVVDPGIVEFYDALGLGRHTLTVSGPIGTERLLSVKRYVMDRPELTVFADEEPYAIYESEGVKRYVYDDWYARPIGQSYTTYILRSEFDEIPDKYKAVAMLHALVIRDEDEEKVKDVLTHDDYTDYLDREDVWIPDLDVIEREGSLQLVITRKAFRILYDAWEEKEYVFFSLPYSERWSATVNGEPVEILNINGLMAIPATHGLCDIRFDYDISIVLIAAGVCALSFFIEALVLLISFVKRKKKLAREKVN